MPLKEYQETVLRDVHAYLEALAEVRAGGETAYGSLAAWDKRGMKLKYAHEKNGLDEDLPRFCIKVPTGGGKTLLATQILGSIHQTILADRNGAGLVLWVVPSSQIYRDTLKRLRDREDLYRVMLEHAVSRRIELWEKTDIVRMTPAQRREGLNILIVQLASTNRETKDQLKFFQDSGGNIVQHFPPEDDPEAHRRLKQQFMNLEMIEDDPQTGRHLVKTSVGNLVRLCRPAVILDEGHKATSNLAQRTLRDFNASIIVELSATPHKGANVLSRVTGQQLLDEEMIKLPLNIATSGAKSWKDILTRARDKREALENAAHQHIREKGAERAIRPIVLVQVERTGKDQRDSRHIHSEQVKEYLVQRLGIAEKAIAIKTSETDDIEGIELMDPECPVTWIITKAALQEGWDCPFAYILVSLDNTGSSRAMTQLIGRILRQPYQERTGIKELDESYVYCLRATARQIAKDVKEALEREGYEGDYASAAVVDQSDGKDQPKERTARIRPEFSSLYTRPFEGKIYLPRFCVRDGDEYEALDYFRHLMSTVDVDAFDYVAIDWPLADELERAKDRFYSISLGAELNREYETDVDLHETDEQVRAWLVASLPFDYLSHKQLRRIVGAVVDKLYESELNLRAHLGLVKFAVRDRIERFVKEQVDAQTHAAFDRLHEDGRLCFYLECAECRFEVPESIQVKSLRRLTHDDGEQIAKSLFDYVDDEAHNQYERAVALCLDRDANVLWWYRNLVGPENFAIQGYRRERIRPDFVVQSESNGRTEHRVVVIESKGKHLEGNPDTDYKRKIAEYFNGAGAKVTWQQLGNDFKDHVFRFQILDEAQPHGRDWSDELCDLLAKHP